MGRYRRGHKYKKGRGNRNRENQSYLPNNDASATSNSADQPYIGRKGDSSSWSSYSQRLTEADWVLLEKYLAEYRTKAFQLHYSKQQEQHLNQSSSETSGRDYDDDSDPVIIGRHLFAPLNKEICSRPYLDLPDSFNPKERRLVHNICANLDLYHHAATGLGNCDSATKHDEKSKSTHDLAPTATGVSAVAKRRVVISIFANGLEFVPDLDSGGNRGSHTIFPSRRCRPWYYLAFNRKSTNDVGATEDGSNPDEQGQINGESNLNHKRKKSVSRKKIDINRDDNERQTMSNNQAKGSDDPTNQFSQRIEMIEKEKQQIRQFVRHPERSLRDFSRFIPLAEPEKAQDTTLLTCEEVDSLDLGELESKDLSHVPTPKETPWVLVDTVEKLKHCVDEMMSGSTEITSTGASNRQILHELAFDMEMHYHGSGGGSSGSSRHKSEMRTCLIQLTSNVTYGDIGRSSASDSANGEKNRSDNIARVKFQKDYIIDPLAPGVWDAIPLYLGPIFSNPRIVKVGHGIGGMDVSSLHRDFGIIVVNAFDTYEASTVVGSKGMGLASLCKHYGLPTWKEYQVLKEKYQCSDWRKRPLDEEALEYGRYDVRYLLMLRKLLIRDLVKLDRLEGWGLGTGIDENKMLNSFLDDETDPSLQIVEETNLLLDGDGGGNQVGSNPSSLSSPILYSFDSRLDSGLSTSNPAMSSTNYDSTDLEEFSDAKENFDQLAIGAKEYFEDEFVDAIDCNESLPSSVPPQSTPATMIVSVSELRYYPHLMNAIALSQKRCLNLWRDDTEPILKNHAYIAITKEAYLQKGHGRFWTNSNMELYKRLTDWRADVAQREGMHSSEVCSLDFLVFAAYKLPTEINHMRRFCYILPPLLEDESLPYLKELCQFIISSDVYQNHRALPLTGMMSVDTVYYHDTKKDGIEKCRSYQRFAWKILTTATIVGAVAFTLVKLRKR